MNCKLKWVKKKLFKDREVGSLKSFFYILSKFIRRKYRH